MKKKSAMLTKTLPVYQTAYKQTNNIKIQALEVTLAYEMLRTIYSAFRTEPAEVFLLFFSFYFNRI